MCVMPKSAVAVILSLYPEAAVNNHVAVEWPERNKRTLRAEREHLVNEQCT